MTAHPSWNYSEWLQTPFKSPLQGPSGYKGIQGPAGIPGPPVRKHQDSSWLMCHQGAFLSLSLLITGWGGASGTTWRGRRYRRQSMESISVCFCEPTVFVKLDKWNKREKFCSEFEQEILVCVAKYNEDIYLPQGSRGIRGPQGAVGKKGDNVSKKGKREHTHMWCLEATPNQVHWSVWPLLQGLPGIDGKDGTPGIPGIKVRMGARVQWFKLGNIFYLW